MASETSMVAVPHAVSVVLNPQASLSIEEFLNTLAFTPTTKESPAPSLSTLPPTHFQSISGPGFIIELSTLLTTPFPSHHALEQLRSELQSKSSSHQSICLHSGSRSIYYPLWVETCWVQMQTIHLQRSQWISSKAWLQYVRRSCSDLQHLAESCLSRLQQIPWDAWVPGSKLMTNQLWILISDSWLTDEHINAGGHLINSKLGPDSSTRVTDTFFLETLKRRYARHQVSEQTLDSLVKMGEITRLLIPVHQPNHWTLLLVDLDTWGYSFFDSLNPSCSRPPGEALEILNWWIQTVLKQPTAKLSVLPPTFTIGRQRDNHSCGIAILRTMLHISHSASPWSQAEARRQRMEMFLEYSEKIIIPSSITTSIPVPNFDDDLPSPTGSIGSIMTFRCPEPLGPFPTGSSIPKPSHLIAQKALRQTTLPFPKLSLEDWRAHEKLRNVRLEEELSEQCERVELNNEKKSLKRREYERSRKQEYRKRKKEEQASTSETPQLTATGSATIPTFNLNIAEASRPYRGFKGIKEKDDDCTCDQEKTGSGEEHADSSQEQISMEAQRVNWKNPLIWSYINEAVRSVGFPWSPTAITKFLQDKNPQIFAQFHPQRICEWRDREADGFKWKDSVLNAVENGNRPNGIVTRKHIFAEYPQLLDAITRKLAQLRQAGVALAMTNIRGIVVALIQHYVPELFSRTDKNGKAFRCTEPFLRRFLRKQLHWSVRSATRAAQKMPPNLHDILLRAFYRMACLIRDEEIPACCIVNADQTQVVFSPGSRVTWNKTGEKQVSVTSSDEKRAFTLLVAIALSGNVLPFQAIYKGKTSCSLPHKTSAGYERAANLGFRFEPSKTSTYWATHETMQDFVTYILAPYFDNQRRRLGVPDQRCIFQLDCWSVHRALKFRTWMSTNFPWIVLQFVPGGCTGVFQACDVGIQRLLKLAIKRACHADLVNETMGYLDSGMDPVDIINDTTVGVLRDRSVGWLLAGYDAINKPEVVKKAFELCTVKPTETGDERRSHCFNLSYASLTSREARQGILDLRSSDPSFYQSITSHMPGKTDVHDIPGVEEELNQPPEDDEDTTDLSVQDLRNIILSAESAVQLDSTLTATDHDVTVNQDSEALRVEDEDHEDVFVDGRDLMQELEADQTHQMGALGRGQRNRRPSTRYGGSDWWNHENECV